MTEIIITKNTIPRQRFGCCENGSSHYLSFQKRSPRKIWKKITEREDLKFGFDADFQIESYLRYQGSVLLIRFDANSYLYITRAWTILI
jgi:homoserine O-acetyltransferase